MTQEKWENIVGLIKDQFPVVEEKREEEEIGQDREGQSVYQKTHYLIFQGPAGEMKVELIKRPLVEEKKTNFSRRIGGEVAVQYIFSSDEFSLKFKAYRRQGDEWEELKGEDLF